MKKIAILSLFILSLSPLYSFRGIGVKKASRGIGKRVVANNAEAEYQYVAGQEKLEKLKKILSNPSLSLVKEDPVHKGYYILNNNTQLSKDDVIELFNLLYESKNIIIVNSCVTDDFDYKNSLAAAFFLDYFVFLDWYQKDMKGAVQAYVDFVALIKSMASLSFETFYSKYRLIAKLLHTPFGSIFSPDAFLMAIDCFSSHYNYNFGEYSSDRDVKVIEEVRQKLTECYQKSSKLSQVSLENCAAYLMMYSACEDEGIIPSADQQQLYVTYLDLIASYNKESVFIPNRQALRVKNNKKMFSQRKIDYLTVEELNQEVEKKGDVKSKEWALVNVVGNEILTFAALKALLANHNYWIIDKDGLTIQNKTLLDQKIIFLILKNLANYTSSFHIKDFAPLKKLLDYWGLDYLCFANIPNIEEHPAIRGFLKFVAAIRSNFENIVVGDYQVIGDAFAPLAPRMCSIPSPLLMIPLDTFMTNSLGFSLFSAFDLSNGTFLYTPEQLQNVEKLRASINNDREKFKNNVNISLSDISSFLKSSLALEKFQGSYGPRYKEEYDFIFKNLELLAQKKNVQLD